MKKKRKYIYIITIASVICLLIFLFFRSVVRINYPYNPKERNKIVFKDSFVNVQDSLLVFKCLLDKMPVYRDDCVAFCIDDTTVCINYEKEYKIDVLLEKLKNNPIEELKPLSKDEQKRFIQLITYFNNNYLFRAEYYKNYGILEYNYREYNYRKYKNAGDFHSALLRFIILSYNHNNIDTNVYVVLEKKGEIYLCAYKNEKIWEN